MTEEELSQAVTMLDEYLERVTELDEAPFETVIELALAAEYPANWVGMLDGNMVRVDIKLSILSMGMRLSTIQLRGDSMTITVLSGTGAGNVIETGPCPWYIVVDPLNQWLENHPEWMPVKA